MHPDQISKTHFKAHALELLRRVETTGRPLIVTDHGKPKIEVRPARADRRSPLERLAGTVLDYREPTEPVGTADWEILG